jgi:xanthine dehydrogenase accessory factor
MRDLLAQAADAVAAGRPLVWCGVVQTRGSTPQKAGACMLVFADGARAGTLGGGCVEAEVTRRALDALHADAAGGPRLLTFCLDDDYGWDDGLICGGRMTILADPMLAGDGRDFLEQYRALVESGAGCVEAVVLDGSAGPPGARVLCDAAGQFVACRGGGDSGGSFSFRLPDLATRPGPTTAGGIAYLPVLPRITLLIVGGGHVGQAVAQLAASVDFDVEVLDDRESYVSAGRFPTARARIADDPGRALARLGPTLTPAHYCVIVTRGHRHDEEALYHLAATKAGYVGMIGSKRKIRLIYDDLAARGVPAEALARVHAPLGFDVGSQTVPEIAISIVAELIACRNLGTTQPRPRVRPTPPQRHRTEQEEAAT